LVFPKGLHGHRVAGFVEGGDFLGAHKVELFAVTRRRRCTSDGHSGDAMGDHLRHGNPKLEGLRGERP
jgi:hypothetical protein